MQIYLSITDTSNGLRADTGVRDITLSNAAKLDQEFAFPDAGTGSTLYMYSSTSGYPFTTVNYLAFIVDPGNVYADNLATPPTITLEVTTSDGSSAVTRCYDVRREFPLLITGKTRTAITTASQDRNIILVRGRSNMASGYGTVMGRLIMQ